MPTSNHHQLDDLLGTSIRDFDIPGPVFELAVARYEDLGAWLARYWHASPTDGVVYPQGSFRLGTVVQPVTGHDEYDVDLVCRRDLAQASTTQVALKDDCGNGLAGYVAHGADWSPTLTSGKRCWTLDDPIEKFHMDVLPAIPNVKAAPNGILLTDRDLREWQSSNPIDYADWFHRCMREEYLRVREATAVFKRMDVVDVPEWQVKTTLQQTTQALKRHRDLFFAEMPDDKPASIIITTLAALAYRAGGTIFEVLVDVTTKMPTLVMTRDGVYWVANPVQPDENFADRWRGHPEKVEAFFRWIAQAQVDFNGFGTRMGSGLDRVYEGFTKSFGERSARKALDALGTGTRSAREGERLGMAAGTGLLAATTARPTRPIPNHTFHGSLPERGAQ